MADEKGRWFKCYASLQDSEVWDDLQALRCWLWCLQNVNWKDQKTFGKTFPRGSFWCNVRDGAKACRCSTNSWTAAMRKLVELGMIAMIASPKYTTIKVVNWGRFQGDVEHSSVSKNETQTETQTETLVETQTETPIETRSRSIRQMKTEEENNASASPPPDDSSNDKPAKPKRIVFDPMAVELPPVLQSDLGRKAWAAWVTHRKEIGKKLTGETVKQQLKQLHEAGPENAVAMIRASIAGGWQGLFPLKQTQSKPYDRPSTMPSVIPGLEWMAEGRKSPNQ